MLPHVIDVDEAMAPDAPLLFEDMITRGIEPAPTKPSNISKRLEFKIGDLDAGFAAADVVDREGIQDRRGAPGLYRAARLRGALRRRRPGRDLVVQPGPFPDARADRADPAACQIGDLRVYPAEIGGGFGGKTVTYLEPVAALLSKKSGLPVRLMMNREDVFKGTGPTSGSSMWVKIGVTKDGKIVAADGIFKFQAGAFPGSPVMNGCLCAFAPYDIPNAARGRLRRGEQPAEVGGVSRAGLADLRLRGGERAGHVRAEDRHGPAGAAAEERRQHRHADHLRAEARA